MEHYIVSARKYRPMTFDAVVGQHALTTTLKNAIAQKKLAHAYLFCGPRGVGKTTCARIFAKAINCLTPTAEGDACGTCESCRAFDEQRSYNIHELDAASNNSVEDIRELIEQVQIPPQVGRYKVFIIDEVHMLSTAAFNAFLKTLEEPPAHAVFILATTEKHKILPTILSRCQTYDFARITVADAVSHLQYVAEKEGIAYEPEALHVIAEKADGGMRDALSIFDQVASFCEGHITYAKVVEDLNVLDYDEYFAMTDTLLKGQLPDAMLRLDRIIAKGFEANYFIGGLASHFRNLLMARDAQTLTLLDVSDQTRAHYHEQALRCEPKLLYKALKLCNDCDMSYRTARNKRLLVELTLIQVGQAAAGDDDPGCGRGPTRRLSPLFNKVAPAPADEANAPAPTNGTSQAPAATPAETASPPAQPPAAKAYTHTPPAISALAEAPATPPRRMPRTISIKGLQAVKTQTATAPAEQREPDTQRVCTPFGQDSLVHHWLRFAQQLPQEKAAIAGRMKRMDPQVNAQWEVSVTLDNDLVENYMRGIETELRDYLRANLHNDCVELSFHVAPTDHKPMMSSRMELLKDMLKRSPALELLRKELDLGLS